MKILLSAVFINNIVLIYFLGMEWILSTTNKSKNAFGIIVASILVMVTSSFSNYLIYYYIIKPYNLEILTLLLFSGNILLMSLFVSWFLKHFFNILYIETKEFISVAAVSSLILGVSILNIDKSIDIYNYMYMNFCNTLGFAMIVILLTTIRERLIIAKLPSSVMGAPILLITLGLISMAFMGFIGVSAHL